MKKILSHIKFVLVAINFLITVTFTIIVMYATGKKNRWIRIKWASFQLKALGVKLKVKGELDLDAKLLLINHQSMLDIMIYESIHPLDLAWVAKKEIANIPWFGRILDASNMIILDRADKRGLIKLIRDSKDRLDNDRVLVIFPEGTRGDGTKLLKFKQGAKVIAEKFNLKIQPIVLTNTKDVFDSQNFMLNGGEVGVHYLPSFIPDGEDWYKNLHQEMREVFENDMAEHISNR